MNIIGAIVLLALIAGLCIAGRKIRSSEATKDYRWAAYALWGAAGLVALVFFNNHVYRIPNPFGLESATFEYQNDERRRLPAGPLKPVPPTNADPAAAAAHMKGLQDAAKTQQEQGLKKPQ